MCSVVSSLLKSLYIVFSLCSQWTWSKESHMPPLKTSPLDWNFVLGVCCLWVCSTCSLAFRNKRECMLWQVIMKRSNVRMWLKTQALLIHTWVKSISGFAPISHRRLHWHWPHVVAEGRKKDTLKRIQRKLLTTLSDLWNVKPPQMTFSLKVIYHITSHNSTWRNKESFKNEPLSFCSALCSRISM